MRSRSRRSAGGSSAGSARSRARGDGDVGEELRSLGTRLAHADGELAELRALLGTLHERARAPAHGAASDSDDAAAHCVDRRLDAVVDLQLHQDVRDVILDRLRADVQLARRSLRCPCRSRSASAPRSRGPRARRGSCSRSPAACSWRERAAAPSRDVRRDQRLAVRRRANAGHQLLDRRVLQQVAARAREDRVHHVAVLFGDRQHDDARQRRDRR